MESGALLLGIITSGKSQSSVVMHHAMNLEFLALVNKWALTPESKGKLIGFEADDARFSLDDNSFLVLLNVLSGTEHEVEQKIEHFSRVHQRGILHLVVLGDSGFAEPLLSKLDANSTSKCRFYCYRLGSDGKVWTGPSSDLESEIAKTLTWLTTQTTISLPEPATLQFQIQDQLLKSQKEAEELEAFQRRYQGQTAYLTYSVAALLGIVFGLEAYFGGTTQMNVLSRMGANMPALVFEGEWWRLLSAAFLHSGWLHAACNIYVLVALGKFMEQLIGGSRLLSLLVLSALGGSLASLFSSPGASVGASGALWGLFGASGALAFWPQGIIPAILVPRLKRSILVNLGINLLISFAPQIDMAAHLGGGVTGALLAGSGLLFWGRGQSTSTGKMATPRIGVFIAALLAGGSLLCFGLAQYHGQPWALTKPWNWKSVEVAQGGLVLTVPGHASKQDVKTERELHEYIFGDFGLDGFVVGVAPTLRSGELRVQEELDEALEVKKSSSLPEGAERIAGPRLIKPNEYDRGVGIFEIYEMSGRARIYSGLLWIDRWLVRLDWVRPASDSEAERDFWKIAQSLRDSTGSAKIPKE